MNLLDAARDVHSQNGEDGIIAAVFSAIGEGDRWCCEFGAWDGIHFSNTRALIEAGWSALLIEADSRRFAELQANNAAFGDRVVAVNQLVTATGADRLDAIADAAGVPELDLLVLDIDGFDFEVLDGLSRRPRVVCVEVNAGHDPSSAVALPRDVARDNVGQPFGLFHALMAGRGYQLVAYSGNAFYVRDDEPGQLPALTPQEAYAAFLANLDEHGRRWLFHVNRGHVAPYHRFANPLLERPALGLSRGYVDAAIRARGLVARRR
jgi:hypothetical protein